MMELVKKYKSYAALFSTMATVGGALFLKIDAYAQGKVDAGVEALRSEVNTQMSDVKLDINTIKVKQAAQQGQLDRIENSQADVIHLLLDMKKKDSK